MKRYEMIQQLAKAIHLQNRPEIDSNHSYAIVEALLKKCEELGMLPPERKISLKDAEALRSWSVSDNIKCYYSWEPEND